jgi:hypothetical protein
MKDFEYYLETAQKTDLVELMQYKPKLVPDVYNRGLVKAQDQESRINDNDSDKKVVSELIDLFRDTFPKNDELFDIDLKELAIKALKIVRK